MEEKILERIEIARDNSFQCKKEKKWLYATQQSAFLIAQLINYALYKREGRTIWDAIWEKDFAVIIAEIKKLRDINISIEAEKILLEMKKESQEFNSIDFWVLCGLAIRIRDWYYQASMEFPTDVGFMEYWGWVDLERVREWL